MAAPKGNTNAKNKGLFRDSLRKALARNGGSVELGLLQVAEKLVESALQGESWAIQEIANRFDGKPKQEVDLGGDEDRPIIHKVIREIIDPKNRDS